MRIACGDSLKCISQSFPPDLVELDWASHLLFITPEELGSTWKTLLYHEAW